MRFSKSVRFSLLFFAMTSSAQVMANQDELSEPRSPVAALAEFQTNKSSLGDQPQSVPYLLNILDESQKRDPRAKANLDRYTVFSEYLYNRIDLRMTPHDPALIRGEHRDELIQFVAKLDRLRSKIGRAGILVEFKNLPVALLIELQEPDKCYEVRAFRPKSLSLIPAECRSREPSSSGLRLEKCYLDGDLYQVGGFSTETNENDIWGFTLWDKVSTSLKLAMLLTLTAKELEVDWGHIDQTYISLKNKPFSEIVSLWVRTIQAEPRGMTNP